jgi:hypothetical protein
MRTLAEARNGKCLSEQYKNNKVKLRWVCSEGHQWEATPNHIKKGTWCPTCSGFVRLSIDDMHSLASKMNGKCLSYKYVNIKTKLLWECSLNHRWKATPQKIRLGGWCPICDASKHPLLKVQRRKSSLLYRRDETDTIMCGHHVLSGTIFLKVRHLAEN